MVEKLGNTFEARRGPWIGRTRRSRPQRSPRTVSIAFLVFFAVSLRPPTELTAESAKNTKSRRMREDLDVCAGNRNVFVFLCTAILEVGRASRGFSEVGQIAPQAPVRLCATFHRCFPKRLPCLLRAPRAAGNGDHCPYLSILRSEDLPSGFWILGF